MSNRMGLIVILLTLLIAPGGQAQDEPTCPALVNSVVEVVADVCGETGRNEACYGNVLVTAQPFPNVTDFNFVQEGDRVSVADIEHLQLSPMNVETDEWGVAVLRIQANLPDTAPGQNVTMVVFGDVELENAGGTAQSDSALPAYAPMQAFYFRSGIGDSACAAAPDSGILIQTPDGVGQVELLVNEVHVRLGSTAVLQAERGESLVVRTLEGEAEVEADGVVQTVAVGQEATVPMNQDLQPTGPPTQPVPIGYETVQAMPTTLLPESVDVVEAIEAGTGMIVVPGYSDWVDSGVQVEAGQVYTLVASGIVNVWTDCDTERFEIWGDDAAQFDCSQFTNGPEGGTFTLPNGVVMTVPAQQEPVFDHPMINAPFWILLGRIGGGTPFVVGTGGTFTANTSGTLQFRINDTLQNPDNAGAFTVEIQVGAG